MRVILTDGLKVGQLTLLSKSVHKAQTFWLCKCDCGTTKRVRQDHLKSSATTSCGCLKAKSHNSAMHHLSGGRHG